MDKKMKLLYDELVKKYDPHCHGPKNMGYNVYLKDSFKFGENIEPGELEFFDDEKMEINLFYTWKGDIYLSDGCGDGPFDMLSEDEQKKFLEYILDENNLKFEH